MPIKKENTKRYPKNWKQISAYIRFERANNHCEECGCENYKSHPVTGSKVILTVAHLDHTPENCDYSNLKAMCQKCHNSYDAQHRKSTRAKTKALGCSFSFDCRKNPFRNWTRHNYRKGEAGSEYEYQLFSSQFKYTNDNIITIWNDEEYCINKNEDYPIPKTEEEFKQQLLKMDLTHLFYPF